MTSAAPAAPPRRTWSGTGVSLGEVLERLTMLRRPPGGGPPDVLAGVLNLLVHAPHPREVPEISAVIEGLADHQPSRAVVLAEEPEGAGIDAALATGCRGDGGGVAVELVVLTLRGAARRGMASAVVPLLRPDVPTVLWWPTAPGGRGRRALQALADLADRVVTEVARCPDPAGGVRQLAAWIERGGPALTDLAWAAITPWRQLIAHMLDREALAGLRAASSMAIVAHPGAAPTAEALLLAGWLEDVVGDGLTVEMRPRPGGGGRLVAVELEGSAHGRRLTLERLAGRASASVRVTEPDGSTRRRVLALPALPRASLLAGDLELQRRDAPFERAVPRAARLAGAP